jgi:hypothetical protein
LHTTLQVFWFSLLFLLLLLHPFFWQPLLLLFLMFFVSVLVFFVLRLHTFPACLCSTNRGCHSQLTTVVITYLRATLLLIQHLHGIM